MSEAVACPKLCGRLRVHTLVCIALKYPHHGYMVSIKVSIIYVVDIKSNRLEKGNEILAFMGQSYMESEPKTTLHRHSDNRTFSCEVSFRKVIANSLYSKVWNDFLVL